MVRDPIPPGEPPGGPAPGAEDDGPGAPSGLIEDKPWMIRLERAYAVIPAAILFAMMMLTVVSVFLRYVMHAPISGAFEVMSYMMGLLVFTALILVAARSDHVRISLLDSVLPVWMRRSRAVLVNLMLATVSGGLGWRLWRYGVRLDDWGERTQIYRLPTGLLARIMAVSMLICALLFVLMAVKVIVQRSALNRIET